MGQYTLPFNQPAYYNQENFFISDCNRHAFNQIEGWPSWQAMLLTGPAGSGKTHLGYIWAKKASAQIICADTEELNPEEINSHLLIDGIKNANQTALFHVINLCKEQGFSLLLTSEQPAKQLGFTLPDLTSRLLALPTVFIDNPDDDALAGVMCKQFADRQIGASQEVASYLLSRIERSFSAVSAVVTLLDEAMWEQKKNLTIPFIRKVMDQPDSQAK